MGLQDACPAAELFACCPSMPGFAPSQACMEDSEEEELVSEDSQEGQEDQARQAQERAGRPRKPTTGGRGTGGRVGRPRKATTERCPYCDHVLPAGAADCDACSTGLD